MNEDRDYQRVAHAIEFLLEAPNASLEELGQHLSLSPGHCQRLFHRWAGLSPKQFQNFVRKERAAGQLRESAPVLEAAWEAGLSGPGRLHDLMLHWEALTPGQYRRRGRGLTLDYRFTRGPLGELLQVHSERGLCHLAFVVAGREAALAQARARWPAATLRHDPTLAALPWPEPDAQRDWPALHLWGTPFQHKIWEALLRVPEGRLCSYGQLAGAAGVGGARAVGSAVGANPICGLIPCHRVIRETGLFGGYRWGRPRKLLLLAREAAESS